MLLQFRYIWKTVSLRGNNSLPMDIRARCILFLHGYKKGEVLGTYSKYIIVTFNSREAKVQARENVGCNTFHTCAVRVFENLFVLSLSNLLDKVYSYFRPSIQIYSIIFLIKLHFYN